MRKSLCLTALLALLAAPVSAGAAPATSHPLPGFVFDVRWISDHSVIVSAGRDGALEVDESGKFSRVEKPARSRHAVDLAIAGETIITASGPEGVLTWREGDGKAGGLAAPFDIDARDEMVAAVGSNRIKPGDEPIVWIGLAGAGPVEFSPIRNTRRETTFPPSYSRCSSLDLALIRFSDLQDSVWVFLGTEPEVLELDFTGKVLRTWNSEDGGIHHGCGIPDAEMSQIDRKFEARLRWRNARAVADDMIVVDGEPVLFRREWIEGQGTRWTMVRFEGDGSVREQLLDVPGGDRTVLRADLRNGRLALLLWDYPVFDYQQAGNQDSQTNSPRVLFIDAPAIVQASPAN